MLGTFTGWTFAQTYDWPQFGKNIGGAYAKSAILYLAGIGFYLGMEGDTDDGKYNPRRKPDGSDHDPARQPFIGYPDAATSPYGLPWAAGETRYLVQGNQGMFGNTSLDKYQGVYAYDFALDAGEEILAARSGTVVDFFDWIPDGVNGEKDTTARTDARNQSNADMGNPAWRGDDPFQNHIVIRHDASDANHDRAEGGTTVTTFAHYLHGRTQSVRDAFAARGIAAADIIGSTVQQGQVIMRSGYTGDAWYDKLHMDVRTGRDLSLNFFTLPFVFREIGVPASLRWYASTTARVA